MYAQRWLYTIRPGFPSWFMPSRVIENITSGSRQSSGQSSLVVVTVFTVEHYSINVNSQRYNININQIKRPTQGFMLWVFLPWWMWHDGQTKRPPGFSMHSPQKNRVHDEHPCIFPPFLQLLHHWQSQLHKRNLLDHSLHHVEYDSLWVVSNIVLWVQNRV